MPESTATLIPFDRIFRLSSDELKRDYRVNLFNCVKKDNSELIGMFGEVEEYGLGGLGDSGNVGDEKEIVIVKVEELSEGEAENNSDEDMEGIEDMENVTTKSKLKLKNSTNNMNNMNNMKPQIRKKTTAKKMKELDYDLDDPFIDDSEITDVYQSVFELMRGGGGGGDRESANAEEEDDEEEEKDEEEEEEEEEAKEEKVKGADRNVKSGNFFVYRGIMTPEILAKEFEIDVNDLIGDEETGDNLVDEDASGESEGSRKKRKAPSGQGSTTKKPKSKVKEIERGPKIKEKEKEKEVIKIKKEYKKTRPLQSQAQSENLKPNDFITQSVKKFDDLYSSEDGNTTTPSKSKLTSSAVILFNVTGIDPNLLELRTVIKRFRDSAVGTPFSPGKFPSILRPRLNETICSVLKVSRPTPSQPLPIKLFSALASFLPFSPSALNKLMVKKILGALLESTEKTELPKLYALWKRTVDLRMKEEGGLIIVQEPDEKKVVNGTVADTAGITTKIIEDTAGIITAKDAAGGITDKDTSTSTAACIVTSTGATSVPPASPVKRKLKFTDEMRQQVFDIIRSEIDLNNLILLTNLIIDGIAIRPVQSDLNLRKIVYQKLVSMSCAPYEMGGSPLLSTTEISKEFGGQKRKQEKKVARSASEIIFGEAEIEEFLRELDVKTSTTNVGVVATTSNATNTSNNTVDTANIVPENDAVTVLNDKDPLNLFSEHIKPQNDDSNTSLYIDSINSTS